MRHIGIEDGYLFQFREDGTRTPILCPYGQGAGILCCDSCAAFRIENHLDTVGEVTKPVDFVHCAAMISNGRAAAIGRLDV